jgi:hypothetical protein
MRAERGVPPETATPYAPLVRGLSNREIAVGISTLLAIVSGIITNLATSGWNWTLGVFLVVLTVVFVAFEVWRSRYEGRDGADSHPLEHPSLARTQRRSLAPPWAALPTHIRGRDALLYEIAVRREST